MPASVLRPFFAYRILKQDGTVVIDRLPHTHQSTWDVKLTATSGLGGAGAGAFSVPLYSPKSHRGMAAKSLYDLLDYNQRIEGYLSGPREVAMGGAPVVSGTIRQLPRDLGKYEIKGIDTIGLLQQQHFLRSEYFSGLTSDLFKKGLTGYKLVVGDDLWASLGPYSNPGGWAITAGGDEGVAGVNVSGIPVGDGLIYTTTNANSAYTDCLIDGWFRIQMGTSTAYDGAASVGIVVALADTSNFIECRLGARNASSGRWELDAEIWKKTAGAWALQARRPVVLSETSNMSRFQLSVVGQRGTISGSVFTASPTGADYQWALMVNQIDTGCVFQQAGVGASTSGSVGFRHQPLSSAGSPQSWAGQLCFLNRSGFFAQGAIATGARSVAQVFTKAAMLDLLSYAGSTEGSWVFRKNAQAGWGNDTMDFGPPAVPGGVGSVGKDLSASIKLKEGPNGNIKLDSLILEPTTDNFATDIMLSGSGSSKSSGSIHWHNISKIRTYGVLTDEVSSAHVSDVLAVRAIAQAFSLVKSTPSGAKKVTVIRTAGTLFGPSPNGSVREGDYVELHAPHLNVIHQRAQIMAYTWKEGVPEHDLILDAYPLRLTDYQFKRLQQTLSMLASLYSAISPTEAGFVFDTTTGSVNIHPVDSGQLQFDNTKPFTFKWRFPPNLQALQRVRLKVHSEAITGAPTFTITVDGTDVTTALGGANPFGVGDYGELDIMANIDFTQTWHSIVLTDTAAATTARAHIFVDIHALGRAIK